MDTIPIPKRKRHFYEGVIRIIDLICYAVIAIGGIYAFVATPATVVKELNDFDGLVWMWGALLLIGGAVGFAGRLTRYWMLEMPSTVLAFAGILIYFVILGQFTFTSSTTFVVTALVFVALGLMARRWAELQIFATEPGADFRSRLALALRRRTKDYARHL